MLLQDEGGHLDGFALTQAFRQALTRYSRDVPRRFVEDFTGDGTAFQFTFTGPFVTHQSAVLAVEYPAGERPPAILDPNDYELYESATDTMSLSLWNHTPGSGETVRVTYTVPHTIEDLDTATATTVRSVHEQGVLALAVSIMLRQLANRFLHEQESSLFDADAVDRRSKSDVAASRARDYLNLYQEIVGVADGVAPAMVSVDWDSSFAGSGLDHLTHSSKWR